MLGADASTRLIVTRGDGEPVAFRVHYAHGGAPDARVLRALGAYERSTADPNALDAVVHAHTGYNAHLVADLARLAVRVRQTNLSTTHMLLARSA